MNKFLNRRVRAKNRSKKSECKREKDISILNEFQGCWSSLETLRRKARRSFMYAFGDQWGDYIKDPETGGLITEAELIRKEGKVPLKNNVIYPIVSNLEGQFRRVESKPMAVVQDPEERKIGEMMSMAVEYIYELNELRELDADALKKELCSGVVAQRIEYGIEPSKGKKDVWVYPVNTFRLFFNANLEDPRGWDVTHIGELFDIPLSKVKALFAKSAEDREYIESIYGKYFSENLQQNGLQGDEIRSLDFFSPTRADLCRVILGWKLVTEDKYYWHDELDGTWGYSDLTFKVRHEFDMENKRRIEEGLLMGMQEEDILLVEYEESVESYWKYWYLSPYGDVLQSGRSPYWHKEHNYCMNLFALINGEIHPYVEQFIDQQRTINRTVTLIDFIRSSSSKGLLVCDDTAFEGMSRQEVVDEFVRYNGVLFVKPKQGKQISDVIHQVNSNVSFANDFELLSLQLKLINDISGVSNATQGRDVRASTPSSLYAQQTENASNNTRGVFENFKAFRRRRDVKMMKTAQQYYKEKRYIDLVGKDYSEEAKWYDPEKVRDSEIDLRLVDNNTGPLYQMFENDMLKEMFEKQIIDAKTYLENSTLPFAPRLLESIKQNEEQMKEQQQMQGIDPALLQQTAQQAGNPGLMQQVMTGQPGPQDGIVMHGGE